MDERIEAVARALCRADGKDPDEHTLRPAQRAGFTTFVADLTDEGPQLWESYAADAERFVVAIEAMQPFLDRAKRW